MPHHTSPGVLASAVCSSLAVVLASAGPAPADILYLGDTYADTSHILRFDTEGTATTPTYVVSNQTGYMRDLSVDAANGRIYWACDTNNLGAYIGSSGLGGGNLATMNVPEDVYSMTADGPGGYIYYGSLYWDTSGTTRGLTRRGLDGSGPQIIGTVSSSVVYGVDVDPAAGKVYWGYGNSGIRQTNRDGTSPVDVVTGQSYVGDVDVDAARGLVYWISADAIYRAPIDGSWAPQAILTGMSPLTMALSPDGDTVYFGNGSYSHAVYKMNADGSDRTYVTYVYKPVAIDVVVPEPGALALLAVGGLAVLRRRRRP